MNKKIIKSIVPLLLLITIGNVSIAMGDGIIINDETFSFINKENNILLNFDSSFEIENDNDDKNYELRGLKYNPLNLKIYIDNEYHVIKRLRDIIYCRLESCL